MLDKMQERELVDDDKPLPMWSHGSDVGLNIIFGVPDLAAFTRSVWGKPGRGVYAESQVPHHKVHE